MCIVSLCARSKYNLKVADIKIKYWLREILLDTFLSV